jgi:heme-degrading monooxygenase HmoA
MIIRVFEGRLNPGREHEFMAGERELLGRTDIDGLLGVSIGRRLAGGAMHVITLTVWRDLEAIEAFSGTDVEQPVFLTGGEEMVETWSLHHYDAVETPEEADLAVPSTPTTA